MSPYLTSFADEPSAICPDDGIYFGRCDGGSHGVVKELAIADTEADEGVFSVVIFALDLRDGLDQRLGFLQGPDLLVPIGGIIGDVLVSLGIRDHLVELVFQPCRPADESAYSGGICDGGLFA